MTESSAAELGRPLSAKPQKRSRWKRALLVMGLLGVLVAGGLGASMYFFGYPVAWPAWGHPLNEQVTNLAERVERTASDQADELARLQRLVDDNAARIERLSDQVDERFSQVDALQSTLRDNALKLDQQAIGLERVNDARQQNRRAIDALSETLNQSVSERSQRGVSATIDDEGVRAVAREQALVLAVLEHLMAAERHVQRLEVAAAVRAYDASARLVLDSDGEGPRWSTLAAQLSQERQQLDTWPQIDWGAHQAAVIKVGEALRQRSRPRDTGSVARADPTQTADQRPQQHRSDNLWARIQAAASTLVSVRPRDPAKLSDSEKQTVRAMAFQRLLLLESALVTRDVASIRRHADRLLQDIEKLDPTGDGVSAAILLALQELRSLDWPDELQIPMQAKATAQDLLERR